MNTEIHHGYFWIPNPSNSDKPNKVFGTIRRDGKDGSSVITLYHPEVNEKEFYNYVNHNVIWGEIENGYNISLFDTYMIGDIHNETYTSYTVEYVITGRHLYSLNEDAYSECKIKFDNLNNWIKKFDVEQEYNAGKFSFVIDEENCKEPKLVIPLNDETTLSICTSVVRQTQAFNINISQYAYLKINTQKNKSINYFIEIITEFSQFLSFVLQSPQYPQEITFDSVLLFNIKESKKSRYPLIPFDMFKDKLPFIYANWHNEFSDLAPICRYYFNTLSNGDFDVPDFITIAQAIDGYHKRFVNKKDGKDIRQYPHELQKLLDIFDGVEVIKMCNIDKDVFAELRHKYVHLYPDEEFKIKLSINDLYILTQKGIVLLTCCFLHLLGLDNQEINKCCRRNGLYHRVRTMLWNYKKEVI